MDISSYIDHTILKPTTTLAEVEKVCAQAIDYRFAAICVPPLFVKKAKEIVHNCNVKAATVIGFPFGYSAIEAKVAEIVLAIVCDALPATKK